MPQNRAQPSAKYITKGRLFQTMQIPCILLSAYISPYHRPTIPLPPTHPIFILV
uniref:Uncharacterized protein n=1 Tax=Anguilla anguilla TaxID=7936 RepID=A0A0E9R1C2_ANGAN